MQKAGPLIRGSWENGPWTVTPWVRCRGPGISLFCAASPTVFPRKGTFPGKSTAAAGRCVPAVQKEEKEERGTPWFFSDPTCTWGQA